ncbi:MAG: SIMPL domain-containing protein, partial [Erysipelotrichaceae bacterium]|nr:SIMPL domain-containing protein [Erysipelotrichaceae bacterium]
RIKAKVLAEALGVELGEVVNIDYSWTHLDIMSRSYHVMECDGMLMAPGYAKMSMEPDDIELEDSVTVIWTIK